MTIEEIMDAANNGDVGAALAIAQVLTESDDPERYDKALPWYEKAAVNGSAAGLQAAWIVRQAKANTAKHCGEWDTMIGHVLKTVSLCNIVFEKPDAYDEEMFSAAGEKFEYACYLIALERYIHSDYKAALHRLEGIEGEPTPLMRILRGCAVFDDALETGGLTGAIVKAVYEDLCPLEQGAASFVDDETDDADAFVLSSAFFYLSGILRNAPINDVQRAYNLLKNGAACLPEGQGRNNLLDELKCYRQKMFGGIQYVG